MCTSTSSASSGATAVLVGSTWSSARSSVSCASDGLSLRELDRGERARRVGVAVETVEQLLGLLEASLADAQVGEPGERAAAQRAVTERPQPHGLGQRGIGLGPAPGRGEHAAVVRAAERRHRGKAASLGDRLADPDPLIGAGDVVGVLARREELAEDLLQHAEVVDVAARDRGERLVEEHHALLGPVGVHEARAEVGERHELEIAVAEAASHLEGLAKQLLLLDRGRPRTCRC